MLRKWNFYSWSVQLYFFQAFTLQGLLADKPCLCCRFLSFFCLVQTHHKCCSSTKLCCTSRPLNSSPFITLDFTLRPDIHISLLLLIPTCHSGTNPCLCNLHYSSYQLFYLDQCSFLIMQCHLWSPCSDDFRYEGHNWIPLEHTCYIVMPQTHTEITPNLPTCTSLLRFIF